MSDNDPEKRADEYVRLYDVAVEAFWSNHPGGADPIAKGNWIDGFIYGAESRNPEIEAGRIAFSAAKKLCEDAEAMAARYKQALVEINLKCCEGDIYELYGIQEIVESSLRVTRNE